tara:strand:+ start:799 stop:1056 length:258 start_codon:yes stop_codon:yes gene_type:complete
MTNQVKEKSVISYIDCIDTLNKIVEITLNSTNHELIKDVFDETHDRIHQLINDAKNDLDKQELLKLGNEVLKRQKVRYEKRLMNS